MSFSLLDSRTAALVFVAVLTTACRSNAPTAIERVGVLHFDNLSGDPQLDWLQNAAPKLWKSQLSGSRGAVAIAFDNPSQVGALDLTRVISGYFLTHGGQLRAHVGITGADGSTTKAIDLSAADPVSLLEQISAQFGLPLRPLPSKNLEALTAYGRGLSAKPQEISKVEFAKAAKADPAFGLAWLQLIELLQREADKPAVATASAQALAQKSLPGLERAEILQLSLPNTATSAQRLASMEAIAKELPADGSVAGKVAEFAVATRAFPNAREWYKTATQLLPDSPTLWNSKGYAEAFGGDLNGAVQSMQRYQALSPTDSNANDSLGEIYYMHGRFAEAEASFLAGFAKQPNALGGAMMRKAAWSRLRSGDVAGSKKLFDQYLQFRKKNNDPFEPIERAQWEYLTGAQPAAKERLEKFAIESKLPNAYAQLSLWARFEGDQPKAAQLAQKAVAGLARSPQFRNSVAVAYVLAQPNAPAPVWIRRFNGSAAASVGMLLSGDYAGAAQFLEQVRAKTNPLQEYYWRDLHSIALFRAGKKEEAKALLRLYSLPETTEDSFLLCFAFPADQEIRRQLAK